MIGLNTSNSLSDKPSDNSVLVDKQEDKNCERYPETLCCILVVHPVRS